ncbi:MAG: hypothetical protein OEY22_02790 [Candidatus Bathyarchaeota archaeon]|nr:hypothetical protein [Candidatus Bathyarchaeota archaeon]MDH5788883.1 hypothetical protein [Candidatus Bathyarchaeota archaeon]
MSETVRTQGIGIHELLRYVIPGYAFLLVLLLPFMLSGTLSTLIPDWEQVMVPLFLVGGLLAGYLMYQFYYVLFRNIVYTSKTRRSLKKAMELTGNKACSFQVLAVHQRAMSKVEKADKETYGVIIFHFSIFHSIGTTFLSVWFGWLGSILIAVQLWLSGMPSISTHFWAFEVEILVLLLTFSVFLCSEYKYRTRLAIEMEDQVAVKYLEEVVEEWKKTQEQRTS